jgi:FKBP-type peptidyl-prolyl cis-trans isomerase SlyD
MNKPNVITFHYVLFNSKGEVLENSKDRNEPLTYLSGTGQIIEGLDQEIQKMKKGEKKKITVPAALAYGEPMEELIMTVSRSKFPKDAEIKVGDRFNAHTEDGHVAMFVVEKVGLDEIVVNGNHPLAGQDLTFDVEVVDMREATDDELAHGHAHGPNGHHH